MIIGSNGVQVHELRVGGKFADPVEVGVIDAQNIFTYVRTYAAECPMHTTRLGAEQQMEPSRTPCPHRSLSNIVSHFCARGEEDCDAFRGRVLHSDFQRLLSLVVTSIDVNARNADGQTALGYAVAHAIPRCVATLLEAGAELTRGAVEAAMREGSPRGLQMLFRADRTCIYWALEWMEEYRTIFGASIKYNVAYVDRIWAGGSKLDGFLCYERDQRRALATIVQRHVVGHRVPPEMSQIIAAFWGHPGGYVVL